MAEKVTKNRNSYLGVVDGLHTSLDPEHLPDGVLVAMLDLKLLPLLPEFGGLPRVAHLGAVGVDGSGAVDLAQHTLQVRKPQAHIPEVRRESSAKIYNIVLSCCK